jgi:ABC-2 type transport system permease protein
MPIYEQTYRRWEARAPLRSVRFWPITREALRLLIHKRVFWFLLAFATLPVLAFIGRIYAGTHIPQAGRLLAGGSGVFGEFLGGQVSMAVILTIYAGAGLVASDLRTGAILIYLSRPLTRRDYVLGKLGVLLIVNLSITLVPGWLLYVAALGLSPDRFARWDLAWVPAGILGQSLVMAATVSVAGLAVSSLAKSVRAAGLGFFLVAFGLELIHGLVRGIFRTPSAGLISFQEDLRIVGRVLFGATRRAEADWILAAAVLVVFTMAGLAVLRARVRAVEIVR